MASVQSKRVDAYMGLPSVDDVTTTQTNMVWRDKLRREERAQNEWHMRWGDMFGVSRPDTSGPPIQRRPIRTPPTRAEQIRASNIVEPTDSSRRYDAAMLEAQGAAMRWPTNGGGGKSASAGPRSEASGRAPSERSASSAGSGRARSAATGRSGATGLSRASGASGVGSLRAVSISGSTALRNELLQERRDQLQRQLEQVDQLLKCNAPSTQRSILAMEDGGGYEAPPPPRSRGGRRTPAPALVPERRLATPSPVLPKKHEMDFYESLPRREAPLAPLCMDPKAVKNTSDTGTGMAMVLPGRFFAAGGMSDEGEPRKF